MARKTFYRLGMAPYVPVLSGLIFDNYREAARRAKDENHCGEYRGRGIRVYKCDENGSIVIPDLRKPCTCLGCCRGAEGLGEGWKCEMAA